MLASLCIFCTLAALDLHEFLGAPEGLPTVLALVASYLMPSSIALWLEADAKARGRSPAYDFNVSVTRSENIKLSAGINRAAVNS